MRTIIKIPLFLLVWSVCLGAADPQPVTYAPMITAVGPAVVTIHVSKSMPQHMGGQLDDNDPFRQFFDELQRRRGQRGQRAIPQPAPKQQGQGSGVIVAADGLILTNNHVIAGADDIQIHLHGERGLIPAKLVGADPKTDLAVLRIDPKGRPLHAIVFADSDKARAGDLVFAIGNPFGVGSSVSMGIISATGRGDVHIADYENFIQTDASINPGNSGGALVDSLGRLVGINTAIFSRTGGNVGIGFAVPANLAKQVMVQLVSGGKVVRGYLGVQIGEVSEALARKFKVDGGKGALVGEVVDGSPAAKAGLQAGDVIVKLDATAITDPHQLRLLVAGIKPGTDAVLTVIRDGKSENMKLTVGELPDSTVAAGGRIEAEDGASIGVTLRNLTAQTREEVEIPAKIEGVLIGQVETSSRAERAGLRPGMVITEVERRAVADASAAVQQLRSAKGEILLRVWASEGGLRWVVVPE